MAFLSENDYSMVIMKQHLDQVLSEVADYTGLDAATVRQNAENAAQAEMTSYLKNAYNTTTIFGSTGTDRNDQIIMYMCDIALYHLHSQIAPDDVPTIRSERRKEAIKWLEMVRDGSLSPDLPALETQSFSKMNVISVYDRENYRY